MTNSGENSKLTANVVLRWVMGISLAVAIISILWYFREVVAYILVSAVLAIIGRPLVRFLSDDSKRICLPRWASSAITLLLLWIVAGGLLILVVPLVSQKVYELSTLDLSAAFAHLELLQGKLAAFVGESVPSISEQIHEYLISLLSDEDGKPILSFVVTTGMSVVIALFSISFITFFFLKEDGLFSSMVAGIFPEKYSENVHRAIKKVTFLLSRYFTGILIESLTIASIITTVLWLFGMEFKDACFIAVIMGLFNVVPYAGPAVGGLTSLFIGIVSPISGCTIEYTIGVVVGTLCVVKLLDDFFLQPYIYSSKVQAYPLEIFIVILMAGSVGGVMGLLVAVPIYTAARVFAKEFFSEVPLVRKLTKKI